MIWRDAIEIRRVRKSQGLRSIYGRSAVRDHDGIDRERRRAAERGRSQTLDQRRPFRVASDEPDQNEAGQPGSGSGP